MKKTILSSFLLISSFLLGEEYIYSNKKVDLDILNKNGIKFIEANSLNKLDINFSKNSKGLSTKFKNKTINFKNSSNLLTIGGNSYKFYSKPFTNMSKFYIPFEMLLDIYNISKNKNILVKKEIVDRYKKAPSRIISVAPYLSEIIYNLGDKKKLVGRSKYCIYPRELNSVKVVGGMMKPSIETIISLNPDLILGVDYFLDEKYLRKLNEFSIENAIYHTPKNFNETYNNIKDLGDRLNREIEAQTLVATMKSNARYFSSISKNLKKPKVYYVLGSGKENFTAGRDSFINDLITVSGGNNIAKDTTGWVYNFETLVSKDPDIIFGSKLNIKMMVSNRNYSLLSAIRDKRYYFPADEGIFNLGGPMAFTDGLEEMFKFFHPNEYKKYNF